MTFKIAGNPPTLTELDRGLTYMRLIELDNGGILLRATDANGNALDRGNILKINAKGQLRLYQNVDVDGVATYEPENVIQIGDDCMRQPIDRRREGKPLD